MPLVPSRRPRRDLARPIVLLLTVASLAIGHTPTIASSTRPNSDDEPSRLDALADALPDTLPDLLPDALPDVLPDLPLAPRLDANPNLPQRDRQPEPGTILVRSELTNNIDPSKATTVRHLDIPLDRLSLLVRPLALSELEIEAAAWFLILRHKIQEISETEIAIKLENQATAEELTAKKLLEDARSTIVDAEAKLATLDPQSSGYRRAIRELERGKEKIYLAEDALRIAMRTMREFHEDPMLESQLDRAKIERQRAATRRVLDRTFEARSRLDPASDAYRELTATIDFFEKSFLKLEELDRALIDVIPGSTAEANLKAAIATLETLVFDRAIELFDSAQIPLSPERKIIAGEVSVMEILETVEAELSETERLVRAETQEYTEGAGEQIVTQLDRIFAELEDATAIQRAIKAQLLFNVAALQAEEVSTIDRFRIVLTELENKGGDTQQYRQYIRAAERFEFDITDTQALQIRLFTWLRSEEGGRKIGRDLLRVAGILLASAIVAHLLARSTRCLLDRIEGLSNLLREFTVTTVHRSTLIVGFGLMLISLGVSLGPVLALFGGASFVLAFALQSNLGNFASGLMLLLNKPFDVGDEIKIGSHTAFVKNITLVNTTLADSNGNLISIPNNTVWEGDIINYTHSEHRRLVFKIDVDFACDLQSIQAMWFEIATAHPDILDDPKPSFSCPWSAKYEYAITAHLKAWCETPKYRTVYLSVLEKLQQEMQTRGISLATPASPSREIQHKTFSS